MAVPNSNIHMVKRSLRISPGYCESGPGEISEPPFAKCGAGKMRLSVCETLTSHSETIIINNRELGAAVRILQSKFIFFS